MTTQDWMDLLLAETRLPLQMWELLPTGQIRNADGRCPLCAWANLQKPEIIYRGAWNFALKEVFGKDWDDEWANCWSADAIAHAADRHTAKLPAALASLRLQLLGFLKLTEPS
jgi:hypothetical protein